MCSLETHLVEANVLGLLTEALTAEVEVVLADKTGLVLADAATERERMSAYLSFEADRHCHSRCSPSSSWGGISWREI